MYTQCNHCKAIFRVTMKELTTAQGLLRCGECDNIFDAMKTLSTTLPEERRFLDISSTGTTGELTETTSKPTPFDNGFFSKKEAKSTGNTLRGTATPYRRRILSSRLFLGIGISALALLFLLQLAYTGRNWLAQYPLTANVTQKLCRQLGCEIHLPRDLEKINILSKNVYSHPNAPGILTISLSIQNDAVFAQPFPLIEISFLDKSNNVIALRRFTPTEYIKNFHNETMKPGIPSELLLNISDPGTEAVRYQFRFM